MQKKTFNYGLGNKLRSLLFQWQGRRKIHRQIKDRLFRFLFEKDKDALLQLYNALNGTDYQDASKLEIVTIESAIYIVMKNDLAFVVAGTLNLYEHQSSFNPNMPVRFLIYLAKEYQKLIERAEESIYSTKLIPLPTPQCVIFYNGRKEIPEEQVLRLSDAFENRKQDADIELKVKVLNINYGYNKELMHKCRMLEEYARFVDISRQYAAEWDNMQAALNAAVDYCIDHNILSDFLREYRAEVLGMLLERFDVKKYERSLRAEGFEEGHQEGFENGHREGFENGHREGFVKGSQQERERFHKLIILLSEQNRTNDLIRAAQNKEYQEQLFREFHLI